MRPAVPITDLLAAWGGGDARALDAVVSELYTFLHGRAHQALRRERHGHLFQTTDLLHELYLKLRELGDTPLEGTSHFVRLAARMMRHILVDYARTTGADKRGGSLQRVALEFADLPEEHRTLDLLILEDVLAQLQEMDPKLLEMVELRFFLGMTEEEVAEARGVARRTVQREWKIAKRFLASKLGTKPEDHHA